MSTLFCMICCILAPRSSAPPSLSPSSHLFFPPFHPSCVSSLPLKAHLNFILAFLFISVPKSNARVPTFLPWTIYWCLSSSFLTKGLTTFSQIMSHYHTKEGFGTIHTLFLIMCMYVYVWVYVPINSDSLRVQKRALDHLELHKEDCELTDGNWTQNLCKSSLALKSWDISADLTYMLSGIKLSESCMQISVNIPSSS